MSRTGTKTLCDTFKPLAYYAGYYGYTVTLYDVITVNNIDYAIISTCIDEKHKKYRRLKINYESSLHGYIKIDNIKYYMNDFIKY